ncbi:MAG TPA: hypothetical protein G4N91_00720 [Dehalococcoidia bacterium]|nr:hypothetical protein [Dehalococcoidia bacterium]
MSDDQPTGRWFIDLKWLEKNNRSFLVLAQGALCSQCREQMEENKKEMAAADLLANIRDCCSKVPEFITDRSPVLESVFRLFLANGNQPLELEGLSKQLAERRGGAPHAASAAVLSRLLGNERFYGLRQVA